MSLSTPCTAEASTTAGTLPSAAGVERWQSNAPPSREGILMVWPGIEALPDWQSDEPNTSWRAFQQLLRRLRPRLALGLAARQNRRQELAGIAALGLGDVLGRAGGHDLAAAG